MGAWRRQLAILQPLHFLHCSRYLYLFTEHFDTEYLSTTNTSANIANDSYETLFSGVRKLIPHIFQQTCSAAERSACWEKTKISWKSIHQTTSLYLSQRYFTTPFIYIYLPSKLKSKRITYNLPRCGYTSRISAPFNYRLTPVYN